MTDEDAFAPDFLIVGAPKCATSSLHAFLGRSPDVFMCSPKEPHWFSKADLPGLAEVADAAAYRALFAAAPTGATLGEASAFYLASAAAPEAVKARNPQARIIMSLRDPASACVSWHQQLRNGLREDQADFHASWSLQEARARGERLPPYCPEPRQLQYRWLYSYHDQVARWLDAFGPERVLIMRFEEIARAPGEAARRALAHIGAAPPTNLDAIPTRNVRTSPRFPWLQQMIAAPPTPLRPFVRPAKRLFNALGLKPSDLMMKHLSRQGGPAPTVDPALIEEIRACFADDVSRLERLIGVDLSAWKPGSAPNQGAG